MEFLEKITGKFNHWLLEQIIFDYSDRGEPTNKIVLQLFIYRYYYLHESISVCANKVAEELLLLWNETFGKPMEKRSLVNKVKKLFDEYLTIKKHRSRQYEGTISKRNDFIEKLHIYFVIKAGPERPREYYPKLPEVMNREIHHQKSEDDFESDVPDSIIDEDYCPPEKKPRVFLHRDFAAGVVASTLDRTALTTRSATLIISTLCAAFKVDLKSVPCSRESLRRMRIQERSTVFDKMTQNIDKEDFCTVHWDGKIMKYLNTINTDEKCDRLAVIVTGPNGKKQLLGVPDIPSGTGKNGISRFWYRTNDSLPNNHLKIVQC